MSRPTTILFDIDGTLLLTRGAGMLGINRTFQEMFGVNNDTRVPVGGRTDFAILQDLFAANEIDFERHYREFSQRYHEHLKSTLHEVAGDLLPGVIPLLQELKSRDFQLGILTGNAKVAAWLKLDRFGLSEYFDFGGYGDDSADRDVVASQAVEAAQRQLQSSFSIDQCWVIGDTPADIRCARSVGAKVIGVLTGRYDRDDFNDYPADEMVDDLTQLSHSRFR